MHGHRIFQVMLWF